MNIFSHNATIWILGCCPTMKLYEKDGGEI